MKKKIFINNPYWLTLGGGERYTASVAKYFLDRNWQVDIFWPQNLSSKLRDRFEINLKRVNFVTSDWTSGYDLSFWVSDGSLPTSFSKKTLVHFQFPFKITPKVSDLIKSKLYTFVCNSRFTKHFIDTSYHTNSLVLYPPVDTSLYPPGKKTNTILYVGRFSRLTQEKNQLQLIKSFKNISKKLPGWKLIIAGGLGIGHDEKFLASLDAEIQKYPIKLVYNPTTDDLKSFLGQAKIFWSASGFGHDEMQDPTKVEHFGMSVVEAMGAGGVPIITNLGGHKEILDFKSGFLWDSPQELEKLTISLAHSPKILNYMSKQAIARSRYFDLICFQNSLSSITG